MEYLLLFIPPDLFEKGISRQIHEAPVFVAVITVLIGIGTIVAVIPASR